jgi:hypothetical protein
MFNGQAEQDKFVLTMLNFKKNGFFIELGSQHPINTNNTYFLETKYNWKGIMIEYDPNYLQLYKLHRQNSIHVIKDAQQIDYKKLFETSNCPKIMDYLQIDLDVDNCSTLNVLNKINNEVLDEYKFATITFEHDIYSSNNDNDIWAITKNTSRDIFLQKGYVPIFMDVRLPSDTYYRGKQCGSFEDWYVHPDLVDNELITKYKTDKSLFYKDLYTANSIN